MELPMRALRSKDFPQDRQTKLQNTLTPPFLSLSPTPLPYIHYCPRNTSLQSTLVDSVSFLTQFFTSLDPQVHLVSLSVLDLDITAVDSG